jgi:hypothetical protein
MGNTDVPLRFSPKQSAGFVSISLSPPSGRPSQSSQTVADFFNLRRRESRFPTTAYSDIFVFRRNRRKIPSL